jgi:hypothetical protein
VAPPLRVWTNNSGKLPVGEISLLRSLTQLQETVFLRRFDPVANPVNNLPEHIGIVENTPFLSSAQRMALGIT